MSRARPIVVDNKSYWFDIKQNQRKATAEQLELLAAVEAIALDDLLDEGLSQGQIIARLREALHGELVPPEVMERRLLRKAEAARQPGCRICTPAGDECEGEITRHHFVPRWIMRELDNYVAYAARSRCTIPICVGRHRDLHYRNDDAPKSIIPYLTASERAFGVKLLDELREQHPRIFELISGGSEATYEGQLLRDYAQGEFHRK